MKKIVIATMFALCVIHGYSKSKAKRFERVTIDDFNIERPVFDKEADALIIYDIGQSSFVENIQGGLNILFERKKRIKIFTQAGVDYSTISIPYYVDGNNEEEVKSIKAYSVNLENGNLVKTELDISNVYDEKINNNWNLKKFAIPNVKPGTIIEYSYKLETPYKFHLKDWEFQNKIPTLYSEYKVKMVPTYQYRWILQGAKRFSSYSKYKDTGLPRYILGKEYNDMVYEYIMKNVPAFKDEQYITSYNDYVMKLDYQLFYVIGYDGVKREVVSSWENLIKEMIKNQYFGKFIKQSKKYYKTLDKKYDLSDMSEQKRLNFIYSYIKNNFNYNGRNTKYTDQKFKDFITRKEGSSAEINLFYIGLLEGAGIDVKPVILSTRGHWRIKSEFPFLNYFNYVVAYINIDNKEFLSDATIYHCPVDMLPLKCINDKGLVIDKKSVEWISTSSSIVSEDKLKYTINFNETVDSVNVHVNCISSNYNAIYYRSKFKVDKKKIEKYWNDKNIYSIKNITAENYEKTEDDYKIRFTGMSPIEVIQNKVIVNPFIYQEIKDNPLKQDIRTYPVDFVYINSNAYETKLTIPEGYKIISKPADIDMDNTMFKMSYNITDDGNNTYTIKFAYEFKKSIYRSSSYSILKMYFSILIDKMQDRIVLEKIES